MFRNRAQTLRHQRMMGTGERELFADGKAPCVVAFHGFGGTVAEIRPLLDAIARDGYAVDAGLLAGHGTRAEELQGTTYEGWLAGARARMQAAQERHGGFVLLGFSMGSLLAMELASEHPAGLTGLVVLGNALTLTAPMRVPFGVLARLRLPLPDAYLLKPVAGDAVDPAALDQLVTYDRHPIRAAYEVYRAGPRVRALAARITCPVLALHGRQDHVCTWRNATWLAEHVGSRDVGVRIFEHSAHVVACDAERGEVARETLRALDRWAAPVPGDASSPGE